MSAKILFWDFDGTLIESNQSFFDSLNGALQESGYSLSEETIQDFLHEVISWHHPERTFLDQLGKSWWTNIIDKLHLFYQENGIKEEDFEKMDTAFRLYHTQPENYSLFPNAKDVLKSCREKGYQNMILSSNFPELPELLEKMGLDEVIDGCFVTSMIGYEKPREELFQAVLEKTNHPEVCFMIGDNPKKDILGARKVGMKTILVYHLKEEVDVDSNYYVSSLEEIPNILP